MGLVEQGRERERENESEREVETEGEKGGSDRLNASTNRFAVVAVTAGGSCVYIRTILEKGVRGRATGTEGGLPLFLIPESTEPRPRSAIT